jgi:hypothetical protein
MSCGRAGCVCGDTPQDGVRVQDSDHECGHAEGGCCGGAGFETAAERLEPLDLTTKE